MKRIRLLCTGLDSGQAWRLIELLRRRYDVEILRPRKLDSPPDLSFFGVPWRLVPLVGETVRVDCLRVAVVCEDIKPNFKFFDYGFSFEETDDKNFQFPYFCNSIFFEEFRTGRYGDEVQGFRKHPKDSFCNFVHSYAKSRHRSIFVKKLMAYKRVDCPGEAFNNMPRIGTTQRHKLNFIKRHKFTIAFENRRSPNYVTEKIFHALLVNSVPIYWGSPIIAGYFNPEAFINCHDYDNFDQVVERVIEVDNDDELYRRYAQAPPVLEGSRAYAASEEATIQRLEEIVAGIGQRTPVVTTTAYKLRRPFYRLLYVIVRNVYSVRTIWLRWKWRLLE